MRNELHPDNPDVMNARDEFLRYREMPFFITVKLHRLVSDLTHMEVFAPLVAYHKDVPQGTDLESPAGFH